MERASKRLTRLSQASKPEKKITRAVSIWNNAQANVQKDYRWAAMVNVFGLSLEQNLPAPVLKEVATKYADLLRAAAMTDLDAALELPTTKRLKTTRAIVLNEFLLDVLALDTDRAIEIACRVLAAPEVSLENKQVTAATMFEKMPLNFDFAEAVLAEGPFPDALTEQAADIWRRGITCFNHQDDEVLLWVVDHVSAFAQRLSDKGVDVAPSVKEYIQATWRTLVGDVARKDLRLAQLIAHREVGPLLEPTALALHRSLVGWPKVRDGSLPPASSEIYIP